MITDKQIEAAARAVEQRAKQIGLEFIDDKAARKLALAAVEHAEAAAWSDDMEAAPKNGEEIDLGNFEFDYVVVGYWNRADQEWAGPALDDAQPTHWRHRPAPPPVPSKDAAA